jgi:L-2-hydroxyglutarate oxidase LhgO
MDYDVLILGGGIIGCAVAYELSKYNLNIALIEKDYDIADDVALINTAIIYDGVECEDTLTSKLERMGNNMMNKLTSKFNVPFKRCGSLIIAQNKEEENKINKIYDRAIKRGMKDVVLLDKEYIYEMEPNLKINIIKALYSKNIGVICPYDLALAYGEIAFDNNVNFKLEEEVIDIKKTTKGFKVETNKNKFTCKLVINTTPGENYSIDNERKVEYDENRGKLRYFLLDNEFNECFSNILFTLKNKGEIMYTVPTVQGKTIGAVSTTNNISNYNVVEKLSFLLEGIDNKDINVFYESIFYNEPVVIDDSSIDIGYIKIRGKHYGLVTMTPAIASIVCETVITNINCKRKKDFVDKRREYYRFRDLSNEQRQKIIEVDKRYGKMICMCEKVTEGEIIDAIRRPLGARTLEGIKRRTGAAFGSCQGSLCMSKIVSILARETNKRMTDIVKDSKNSKIVLNRIKEFDSL